MTFLLADYADIPAGLGEPLAFENRRGYALAHMDSGVTFIYPQVRQPRVEMPCDQEPEVG